MLKMRYHHGHSLNIIWTCILRVVNQILKNLRTQLKNLNISTQIVTISLKRVVKLRYKTLCKIYSSVLSLKNLMLQRKWYIMHCNINDHKSFFLPEHCIYWILHKFSSNFLSMHTNYNNAPKQGMLTTCWGMIVLYKTMLRLYWIYV